MKDRTIHPSGDGKWLISKVPGWYCRLCFSTAFIVISIVSLLVSSTVSAQAQAGTQTIQIAAALPLTGDESTFGLGSLQGIQLAIEEANASGGLPRIDLKTYDDRSSDDEAKAVAGRIVASQATLVLGPALSTSSLAAGPIYAQGGIASITTTATADAITDSATTFRIVFKNSDQGQTLALYMYRVLGSRQANVIVVDNGYGHSLQEGFQRAADRLGLTAQFFAFKTADEAEQIAHRIAEDPAHLPIVFLTLDADAARIMTTLRRLGAQGPFLGGDALGDESFSGRFADLPEERQQPGYFSEGVYGISPMILDSANAETLAFAERFRARFGHDPIWFSAAGYDAGRLAVATIRAATANETDVHALRAATLHYLNSPNGPASGIPGLLGPLSFDQARGRQQGIRIGRFSRGRFESAPVQIVPVTEPGADEITSGSVFELEPGRYARLQRVVYTGMFINEISHVDLSKSSFAADFYLWVRFARDAGPNSSDPTDIIFPNLISGSFDRTNPAEEGEMPDGTEYRLWRMRGEFRNDFDLHRFPFDEQTLSLPFFHARAAADRIVYVLDRRSPAHRQDGSQPAAQPGAKPAVVSPDAFRELTQWDPLASSERRENLVTESTLGDPRRTGAESHRELSGFLTSIGLRRRTIATLTKMLLPLLLMSLIMYASLYFPTALVKEKVTVAITAALSGAVLLTAINSQLGGVGYTIAVEYVFYLFFSLSLLCIVSVLEAERMRAAGRKPLSMLIERWTRRVFLIAFLATVAGAITLSWKGNR